MFGLILYMLRKLRLDQSAVNGWRANKTNAFPVEHSAQGFGPFFPLAKACFCCARLYLHNFYVMVNYSAPCLLASEASTKSSPVQLFFGLSWYEGETSPEHKQAWEQRIEQSRFVQFRALHCFLRRHYACARGVEVSLNQLVLLKLGLIPFPCARSASQCCNLSESTHPRSVWSAQSTPAWTSAPESALRESALCKSQRQRYVDTYIRRSLSLKQKCGY